MAREVVSPQFGSRTGLGKADPAGAIVSRKPQPKGDIGLRAAQPPVNREQRNQNGLTITSTTISARRIAGTSPNSMSCFSLKGRAPPIIFFAWTTIYM